MSVTSLAKAIAEAGGAVTLLRNAQAPVSSHSAKAEFTNWRSEQRAWQEGAALLDQSHHMSSLFVRGPGALDLLTRLGTNSFADFGVDKAKQLIMVSPDGRLIGDVVLFHLEDEVFSMTGTMFKLKWIEYQAETGSEDVTTELEKASRDRSGLNPTFYRWELQGPTASEVLERASGQELGHVKFFQMARMRIAGHEVRALRHGMAGRPGFEIFGPWEEQEEVLAAVRKAGEGLGLVNAGTKAYSTANLESGYTGATLPDIFGDSADMQAFREWLPASAIAGVGGSLVGEDTSPYHLSPYELGWGRLVVFDHDFIGREALERTASDRHRKKVTLVWNPEDVAQIVSSMMRPGELGAKFLEFPKARYAAFQCDEVVVGETSVGKSLDCGYLANERVMVSIAVLDEEHAEPGTQVRIVWGESPNTSKPSVEPHTQCEVRATVAPSPYGAYARRNYRAS